MATVYPTGGGGSPAYSSDCTARPANIMAGFTAITITSNDEAATGTLPLTEVDYRYGGLRRYNSVISW